MFYEKRVVDLLDGLPKWSGMSKKSELIADSPPEMITKRKREIEAEEEGDRESKKHDKGENNENSKSAKI
jgi:hypothetical protein